MKQYPEKLYRKLDHYPLMLYVSSHLSETDFLRSQDCSGCVQRSSAQNAMNLCPPCKNCPPQVMTKILAFV